MKYFENTKYIQYLLYKKGKRISTKQLYYNFKLFTNLQYTITQI